jgi:hypothetical protein
MFKKITHGLSGTFTTLAGIGAGIFTAVSAATLPPVGIAFGAAAGVMLTHCGVDMLSELGEDDGPA